MKPRSSSLLIYGGGFSRIVSAIALVAIISACSSTRHAQVSPYSRGPKAGSVYVAEKGDTLEEIAKKFETTVDALKRENGLTMNSVRQGQRIRIPFVAGGSTFLPPNHNGKNGLKEARPKPDPAPLLPASPKITISLAWPVEKGSVTSGFGIRKNGKHDGIDIGAPDGTNIVSAAEGTVIFSGVGPSGYGNIVVVKHSESVVTIYAHNRKNLVEKGRAVRQGEPIALVGQTGRATAPHCHFELRINRVAQDPIEYLPKR